MSINNEDGCLIDPPLRVETAEAVTWSDSADLVVVGFGGAGTACAIQGVELGADVIAVDRFGGGGATAYSGGVTYAGNTRHQRAAGCTDSAENMFNYLSGEKCAVSRDTLMQFCQQSSSDLEWLEQQGVPFDGALFEGKTTYPPEGYYLYYTGNEKTPFHKKNSDPAPRGHRAVGAGFTGYVHYGALRDSALSKGVRLQPHAPTTRLVVDSQERVVGIEVMHIPADRQAEHQQFYQRLSPMKPFSGRKYQKLVEQCHAFEAKFSERRLIRARKGVVLATGGFIYNLPMLARQRPELARVHSNVMRLGSAGCDGSGIQLGQSVGGEVALMDSIYIGRSIAPPEAFLKGIMVGQDGRRLINEDTYNGFLGEAIGREGKAWLILDSKGFWRAVRQCLFPGKGMYLYTLPSLLNILFGGTRRARWLEKLAQTLSINAHGLSETVAAYNAGCQRGQDELGKTSANLAAVDKPPYYAINMNLDNKYALTLMFSLGGLRVDEQTGHVLDRQEKPIHGLFASGRAAVGLCSKSYLSGMSIADTVFSGRRAAKAALSNDDPTQPSTFVKADMLGAQHG